MTMEESTQNTDNLLADLADQILNDGNDRLPEQGLDPGTRALAETLLRLKHAFPPETLASARVKQMEKGVIRRVQAEKEHRPGWLDAIRKAWQTPANRQQYAIAFAVIVFAGIVIVAAPLFLGGSDSTTATAGTSTGDAFIWTVLIVMGICLGWLLRRKS